MRALSRLALTALLAGGCGAQESPAPASPPPPAGPIVGADRDPRGCTPSAGYSWCERTKQCERPWELARKEGFEVSAENFAKSCAGTP